MYRIRRFGVVKTATVVAVLYMLTIAIVGVPVGILVALFGRNSTGSVLGPAILVGVLVAAVFYAIAGWIVTAIACLLYNLAAGWVGGIEVQVEQVVPPPASPVWGPITSSPPAPPTPVWGQPTPPSPAPPSPPAWGPPATEPPSLPGPTDT